MLITPSTSTSEAATPLIRTPTNQRQDIIYQNNIEIPRDVILNYLLTSVAIITSPDGIQDIINDYQIQSSRQPIGLHEICVNYQLDLLENNFQIERKYGSLHMSKISGLYEHDDEMMTAISNFVYSAMKSYLLVLNHRFKHVYHCHKIASGSLQRHTILEFFEACNSLSKFSFGRFDHWIH